MGFSKRSKESNQGKAKEEGDVDRKTLPEVEMTIDSIRVGQGLTNSAVPSDPYQHVVILEEMKGNRYLPIWIGGYESDALAVKLAGSDLPRPTTYDFLCAIIGILGATVESVVMSELKYDCHYAKARLKVDGEIIEVDCRPSDALNVAVRLGAPIFANKEVLDKAAVDISSLHDDYNPKPT